MIELSVISLDMTLTFPSPANQQVDSIEIEMLHFSGIATVTTKTIHTSHHTWVNLFRIIMRFWFDKIWQDVCVTPTICSQRFPPKLDKGYSISDLDISGGGGMEKKYVGGRRKNKKDAGTPTLCPSIWCSSRVLVWKLKYKKSKQKVTKNNGYL